MTNLDKDQGDNRNDTLRRKSRRNKEAGDLVDVVAEVSQSEVDKDAADGGSTQRLSLISSFPVVSPRSGPSYRISQQYVKDLSPIETTRNYKNRRTYSNRFRHDTDKIKEIPEDKSLDTNHLVNISSENKVIDSPNFEQNIESYQPSGSCLKQKTLKSKSSKKKRVRISLLGVQKEHLQKDGLLTPRSVVQSSSLLEQSTCLPSMTSSPVHYMDTTHTHQSVDQEKLVLPDLNYLIERPKISEDCSLRRSRRTRIKHLNSVDARHTIVYRRDSTGYGLLVDSIQPSKVVAKLKAKEKERKNKIRQRKLKAMRLPAQGSTRRLSRHINYEHDSSLTSSVNTSNENVPAENLVRKANIQWFNDGATSLTGTESIAFGVQIEHTKFTTGEMQLGPLAFKPKNKTDNTLILYVLYGKFSITIGTDQDEIVTEVDTGDNFVIEKEKSYSIKNLRRDVGRIYFTNMTS